MSLFPIYKVGSYFEIFRGLTHKDIWYVYNTKKKRYVGGFFKSKKAAMIYAEKESK